MSITDSGSVNNRIRLRSILIAIAIHLALVFSTVGFWLLVLIPVCLITAAIVRSEVENVQRDGMNFKKSFPFRYFGDPFGDFVHIFHCKSDLTSSIATSISRELEARTPVRALREVTITDVDTELVSKENRIFMIADAGRTGRGTAVTLILSLTTFGEMRSVRWWVTAGGYIDRNKRFNFIAYSPLLFWFWIIPYLSKDYDVLPQVRTIYSSSYNEFDITTLVRSLHKSVFDALVVELETHGIDTSDLRLQSTQVMNINVSGGHAQIGNVVQGAIGKVAAKVGVAK
jgi:hypothetical protein